MSYRSVVDAVAVLLTVPSVWLLFALDNHLHISHTTVLSFKYVFRAVFLLLQPIDENIRWLENALVPKKYYHCHFIVSASTVQLKYFFFCETLHYFIERNVFRVKK